MEKRTIPFFNYPHLAGPHEDELIELTRDLFRRGAFILQKDLEEFEENAAKFLGANHFIGVADGTNAIVLCLMAAGVRPGDEVIVPSHTYVASANAVYMIGAKSVLVECGDDHLIDVESARAAITDKTKAIIPVHLNGRICDMDPIARLAEEHNLEIIEDGAQSFGARYNGKSAGTIGKAATISFYPAKVLGCFGDGGGVITDDAEFARRIKELRDHGRNDDGEFVSWGTNSRLDNMQAAYLNFKLKHYPAEINRRREIASMFDRGLRDLEDLNLPPAPEEDDVHFDIYQNYELQAGQRDALRSHLEDCGIRTIIQWGGKPVHKIEALGFDVSLPKTEKFFERCFLIPMNTSLSNEDVEYIIHSIRSFYDAA